MTSSLRFIGEISIWAGLALAAIVCFLSWRYYRRESFDLPHRLRWILPLLRSLAFLLGILILTGPVLHHRKVIGELGKVKIYVDASQSMGLLDRHLSPGRKLLIAQQQGWIESDRLDTSYLNVCDKLRDSRRNVLKALEEKNLTSEGAQKVAAEFEDGLIAARNECPTDTVCEHMESLLFEPLRAIPPATDPASIEFCSSQLRSLCETTRDLEDRYSEDFETDATELIESGDESLQAALAIFDDTTRLRRAERSLLEAPGALLADLKQNHNVQVLALQGEEAIELFGGQRLDEPLEKLPVDSKTPSTDLASGIANSQNVVIESSAGVDDVVDDDSTNTMVTTVAQTAAPNATPNTANTAIVLLTDGQHNSGPSPLQTARVLGNQGIAFYPIAMGATRQAPDLAVTGLEHPEMVFQKDRVRGTMIVRDQMPVGQPFIAEVKHEDEVLWQKQLLTNNAGERRIDFEFGIEDVVDRIGKQLDSEVTRHSVSLALEASINPLQGESETDNNQRTIRLAAITQNYRLLIIDGRSRWETRYLRNAFQRDTQWDVNVVIAGTGTDNARIPRGTGTDMFPENRDGLFASDLIIFGEIDAALFEAHEFKWIREFVQTRGGGIVFIDGQRKRMEKLNDENLGPLLPVEWLPAPISTLPTTLQLTEKGARVTALTFEVEETANRRFWNQIPVPHTLNNVKVLPGAETLVEAIVDGSPIPAMVTRNYGAGRVLYLSFDETWRWRFKAADTYHQRIWNQIAKYVMPRPFAASDEYVSVDAGPVSYQYGDSADIRVRLMGLDGKPATDSTVDALIWHNDKVVSTVSLTPDADVPGLYRGRSGALGSQGSGEHELSVQASGFSNSALKARGQFVVLPPESGELENTACNEQLLKQIAAESGGVYLREEQIGQLSELLKPISSGRVVESDTLLWQSYWWFAAIVILLTLEWFLRKRAGLL